MLLRVGVVLAGSLTALVLSGCDSSTSPEAWFTREAATAFRDHPGPSPYPPFDVAATDLDLDGDPDLLVNWHHMRPLELFENVDGVFRRLNPPERDRSGLFDNRGVPQLFADASAMLSRIEGSNRAGLYVWHDEDRLARWQFLWKGESEEGAGLRLELESSRGVVEIEGLEAHELRQPDARRLEISLPALRTPRRFQVRTQGITVQLKLRARTGARAPAVFVGPELTSVPGGELDLWKPDPHGLAWVDAEGSRHPELYLTRGGVAGFLRPPLDPKVDRYYVHGGGDEPVYRFADRSALRPDYRRGRQVEWVDVDNDGSLELSVSARSTPNGLLVREGEGGVLRDRAARYGIDFRGAEVQAWGDLDDDGFQDLFVLRGNAVDVARNEAGTRFRRVSGRVLGLVLPEAGPDEDPLFRSASLRLADFDNDGRLDLWVLGLGGEGSNHLFLRDGAGFTEVSDEVGLASVRGVRSIVLADFDDDSFEDAVSFGEEAVVWWNRGGQRFEFFPLAPALVPERIHAATACDVDGDGRIDLVLVGRHRHLLRNRSDAHAWLGVVPRDRGREPIGALVWAVYGDGRRSVRRYGSAHNTTFSQALQPLRFGVPEGVELRSIGVRWPGERETSLYEVGRSNATRVLERGAAPGRGPGAAPGARDRSR